MALGLADTTLTKAMRPVMVELVLWVGINPDSHPCLHEIPSPGQFDSVLLTLVTRMLGP